MKTLCCSMLVLFGFAVAKAAEPMNVVFILADDLGWSDTTLYGTTSYYETPHIERLAQRGITFTRAYAASPLCSPTRASILTGLAPARHGITAPNCHIGTVNLTATPNARGPSDEHATSLASVNRLSTDHYTLAEALHDQGYRTGHFGKWHLGLEPYSPLEHGFDIDVPHWHGPGPAGNYVAPWKYPDFDAQTPNEHIEDRMADEAVAFLGADRDRPFFLNYWMFSVHAPFDAKADLIEKHRGRVDPTSPQRCPTYAAMIENMDDAVGTLLDAIDRLGVADRTILVFASDNGGNMYNEVEGIPPTSNAPLRGGKATLYEGGVRGPCVVVWPGVTTPGSRTDTPIASCDFYPTLLDVLKISPRAGQEFDGESFAVTLNGSVADNATKRERPLFTYFPHSPKVPDWLPPAISVHRGDWKLIRLFHGASDGGHRWKLYNLQNDQGETKDLSADRPDLVAELDALIEKHLDETSAVRPLPNPAFDPSRYDPTTEGVSRMGRPKPRPPLAPVAGWQAANDCELKLTNNELVVTSTGNDPHLQYQLTKPLPAGDYRITLDMEADALSDVELFWRGRNHRPAYSAKRSVSLRRLKADGKARYEATFVADDAITALRLDPSRGPGRARMSRLSFQRGHDAAVEVWPGVGP